MSDLEHGAGCDRDDHKRAGYVSVDEAKAILCRFVASHFRDGRDRARFTIPADPRRDDDIRLSAFICQAERLRKAAEEWMRVGVCPDHAAGSCTTWCDACRATEDAQEALADAVRGECCPRRPGGEGVMVAGAGPFCPSCSGFGGHAVGCPVALADKLADVTAGVYRDRIAATVAWARGRMASCDAVVRGEVELHGTDLPEALAERRALREVVRMLEGRDG